MSDIKPINQAPDDGRFIYLYGPGIEGVKGYINCFGSASIAGVNQLDKKVNATHFSYTPPSHSKGEEK